jgi:hypothetical protein
LAWKLLSRFEGKTSEERKDVPVVVLREIFGPNVEDVTEDLIKLQNGGKTS